MPTLYLRPSKETLDKGIPPRYHGARLVDFPALADSALTWLLGRDGMALLTGESGSGKTRLAYACLRHCRYNYLPATFWTVPDLCVTLQSAYDEPRYRQLATGLGNEEELLILDDLGAEKVTDYVLQELYRIIAKREVWGYPTIVTSNLTLDQIAEKFSDRIASRLAGGELFLFDGKDHRRHKSGTED